MSCDFIAWYKTLCRVLIGRLSLCVLIVATVCPCTHQSMCVGVYLIANATVCVNAIVCPCNCDSVSLQLYVLIPLFVLANFIVCSCIACACKCHSTSLELSLCVLAIVTTSCCNRHLLQMRQSLTFHTGERTSGSSCSRHTAGYAPL